jgi:DNA-directed RNA polymerase specialized sigma24 family protein
LTFRWPESNSQSEALRITPSAHVTPWPATTFCADDHPFQVRACIDRLPERYRTVLLLRDIEELDTKETAQQLGITSGTLKTRLHRARQALRALLEPLVLEEGPV